MTRGVVQGYLAHGMQDLVQRGLVSYEIFHMFDRDSIRIRVEFPWGPPQIHEITEDELAMDGAAALRTILDTVRRDSYAAATRHQQEQARDCQALRALGEDHDLWRQEYAQMAQWDRLARIITQPPKQVEADARARAMFQAVAGEEAFKVLERGEGLPLKGSAMGQYTLHRRATYCVERVADGVRLCAVVPGVPLWDHLLGIKLMIEHDESRFLATANVSGGTHEMDAFGYVLGGLRTFFG